MTPKQSSSPLPLRAADVTAGWLEEAIQASIPGARILSADVRDTWNGTATKYHVAIERNSAAIDAGLPESIVVKGRFNPEQQPVEQVYAAEVAFYRDIQPHLSARTPRCFYAGSDSATGQHIVVLEDLSCRNVHFCRVVDPIDFNATAAFLDNMARWHAFYWNSPELNSGGSLENIYFWDAISPGPMGDYGRRQLQPEIWAHYINLPRGVGLPRRFRDRDRMRAALDCLNTFGRTGDMTLVHGDHHLGNLYIDANGDTGVLDWQSYAKGSWSHDLTYFLVSALDIEDRRRWDRALIAYYLSRLKFHGVRRPPEFEAALHAFRIQVFDGLFYWLVNPIEWQVEINNCAVAPRFAAAASDHDSFGIIDGML